ncbi:hypothetical protein HDU99_006684 [Rhizoclosmatium hyalinum]|nr:hypothetical protein HDU99_006684 [Rhizoclosmatium hyalinum]
MNNWLNIYTRFSNWRSKNKKEGNPPPPLPHQMHALATASSVSGTPPPAAPKPPASDDIPAEPLVVDSVKIRPPPKRITNLSSQALQQLQQHASPTPTPEVSFMPANLLASYPPPPDPIPAHLLPPNGIFNITSLMRSTYFTPVTTEDFEVKRRRKLDDEAASNVVAAQKKGMPPAPAKSGGGSVTASIINAGMNYHAHNQLPSVAPTALPVFHQPTPQPPPQQQHLYVPPASVSSSSSSSARPKPKSKKELARAAKLIMGTLKKLKRANNGHINPEAVLLLQQAKNLGLIPHNAGLDGDDDMGLNDSSSDSSSSGSSSSGSDSDSSSGSDSGSGSSSGSSSGSDDEMQY